MTEITYQRESMVACFNELREIFEVHYIEIAENQDVIPLDPDWDRYADLDASDILLFITARKDTKLIGYFIGFITPHLHYKSTVVCATDIYYIQKDYRRTGCGSRLIELAIEMARDAGVVRFVMSAKVAHNLGTLLVRLGFTEFEHSYSRIL
jgi:GNAT superfamily N-acetyltransferase